MKIGDFTRKALVPHVNISEKAGMITQTNDSKVATWILLPVFLALLLSAVVGLQLFQDGSSYLLEMLIDHSAVRHGRLSVLLFQYPTILLIKTFLRLDVDPLVTLPIVRLAFNLNYAITPFISLLLSWIVVRKKREELFLWAALIILFVNLVNFSWVSELLISVQFVCPLLLAMLQNPKSKTFWALMIFLTPFLFFLHPLVTTIYLVFAVVAVYIAYREPVYRNAATVSAILFLASAIARGIYSFFTMNLYEVSFAASGEISDYFVLSRLENILFLATAVEIAVLVIWSQSIVHSKRWFLEVIPVLVFLHSYVLFLFAAHFLLRGNLFLLAAVGCLGIAAYVLVWRFLRSKAIEKIQLLYLMCALLAASASTLLIAQYASAERLFTLKMGLDLFVALLIMFIAAVDSSREVPAYEHILRFNLVLTISTICVCVIVVKSSMWHASVHRLEQALWQTNSSCAEMTSRDFQWLEKSPYTMLNNWSLPSLALVVQDKHPRKALLAQSDCQVLNQSGMIQVDPWSLFSKEFLVPALD
jgi:hypothetical protein